MGLTLTTALVGVGLGVAGSNFIGAALCSAVLAYTLNALASSLSDRIAAISTEAHEYPAVFKQLAGHAVVPMISGIAATLPGIFVGSILAHQAPSIAVASAVQGISILGALLLAGASTTPVGVLTPIVTPLGDASAVTWVLWMLRGFLPALGWLLLVATMGAVQGSWATVAVLGGLVALRWWRLRRSARTLPG